jgi:hypothetical protein
LPLLPIVFGIAKCTTHRLRQRCAAFLPLLPIVFGIAKCTTHRLRQRCAAFVAGFAFRPTRTDIMQAPAAPDLNTDIWTIENIEDAETLLVRRGRDRPDDLMIWRKRYGISKEKLKSHRCRLLAQQIWWELACQSWRLAIASPRTNFQVDKSWFFSGFSEPNWWSLRGG